jgi:hypothetical protein
MIATRIFLCCINWHGAGHFQRIDVPSIVHRFSVKLALVLFILRVSVYFGGESRPKNLALSGLGEKLILGSLALTEFPSMRRPRSMMGACSAIARSVHSAGRHGH